MIPLIVVAAVLIFFALLLFLPLCLEITYSERLSIALHFAGIKLYGNSKNKHTEKSNTESEEKKSSVKNVSEGTFKRLSEKLGFGGAVTEIFGFLKDVLLKIKKLLRHVKINRLTLNIRVATDSAAKTAVTYGAVCTAVYPVLAFSEACAPIALKQINVRSDFTATEPEFSFSAVIKLAPVHIIIAAFAILGEYKNFKTRNEL